MKVSYLSIRVLPELEGKPWNEITQAFLRSQRASTVRVIEFGAGEKTDSRVWRVTVYLDASRRVERIEQEVEVDLPAGVSNGYDLSLRLDKL